MRVGSDSLAPFLPRSCPASNGMGAWPMPTIGPRRPVCSFPPPSIHSHARRDEVRSGHAAPHVGMRPCRSAITTNPGRSSFLPVVSCRPLGLLWSLCHASNCAVEQSTGEAYGQHDSKRAGGLPRPARGLAVPHGHARCPSPRTCQPSRRLSLRACARPRVDEPIARRTAS